MKDFLLTEDLIEGNCIPDTCTIILDGFQSISRSSGLGNKQASVPVIGCIASINRVTKIIMKL